MEDYEAVYVYSIPQISTLLPEEFVRVYKIYKHKKLWKFKDLNQIDIESIPYATYVFNNELEANIAFQKHKTFYLNLISEKIKKYQVLKDKIEKA